MESLKDSLSDHSKTVTLEPADLQFLSNMHGFMQQELDKLMERMAGMFLTHLAVSKFGCEANKDFHFEFHPEKEYDNLIITEKI